MACDPYTGAVEAVLECARNLACVGAEPLGLTNCLNFGNPEKPHIAWQLTRAVEGLRDACLALGVPVVGGNVSLYNEGGGGPIYPTPIVGMVGRLPDPGAAPRIGFAEEGHAIALVGPFAPALEGLELEKLRGRLAGSLPAVDLAEQARALAALREAAARRRVATVHDIARAAWRWRLAECCIEGGLGADRRGAGEEELFGEGPGGVVVAGPPRAVEADPGAPASSARSAATRSTSPARSRCRGPHARALRGRDPGCLRGRRSTEPTPAGAGSRLAGGWPTGTLERAGAAAGVGPRPRRPPHESRQLDHRDGPRDECGVFGVYAPESDVARLAYFALYALQHRGQESAGIATSEDGHIMTVRDLGLVSQVFDEEKLRALQGEMAVGHVRYSTTGSSAWENAQPVWRSDRRQVALAHNGNLINAVELHAELSEQGVQFRGTSDSEIIAALLSTHPRPSAIEDALADVMPRLEGAFSTVVMTKDSRGRPSATRPGCGRWRSASSATATASPPRAAPSTSSAPSCCARSSPARWSRSASAASRRASWWSPSARPSASSSTSTSRARLDPRGQPHAGLAPQDGRDPVARGARWRPTW